MTTNRKPVFALLLIAFAAINAGGCSSLGLSLFPTGHYLTEQAEQVLDGTPSTHSVTYEIDKDVLPGHFLEPGEVLLIEPADFDSDLAIPADQQIMADGSVDLGKYGRVIIAGMTIENAESFIAQTIVTAASLEDPKFEAKNARVNVRLMETNQRYYVLGEVNSPGAYDLEGFETVLDGILEAGGLTTQADQCRILLARPTSRCSCRVTLPVCYREITQMGDASSNYQLQPGDRIYVATRSMCEDMHFWKAKDACPRCECCQRACPDPSVVTYQNPLTRVVPASVGSAMASVASNPSDVASDSAPADPAESSPRLIRPESTESDSDEFSSPGVDSNAPEPSFPELLDPYFDEPSPPNSAKPGQSDGELEFGDADRQSSRFRPMWVR